MGLAEIQALKKLDAKQVYKGKEATDRVKAMLKPKDKKPIPKQSAKKKAGIDEEKALSKLDDIFYQEVWDASPHICQCGCNTKLTTPWKRSYFHHLLPKQSYPLFRHTVENIMLLTPDHHTDAENKVKKMPLVEKRLQEVIKLLLK
jgi:hypothetical protein